MILMKRKLGTWLLSGKVGNSTLKPLSLEEACGTLLYYSNEETKEPKWLC